MDACIVVGFDELLVIAGQQDRLEMVKFDVLVERVDVLMD